MTSSPPTTNFKSRHRKPSRVNDSGSETGTRGFTSFWGTPREARSVSQRSECSFRKCLRSVVVGDVLLSNTVHDFLPWRSLESVNVSLWAGRVTKILPKLSTELAADIVCFGFLGQMIIVIVRPQVGWDLLFLLNSPNEWPDVVSNVFPPGKLHCSWGIRGDSA